MSENNESQKYTIHITDNSGHSTVVDRTLEETVQTVIDHVETKARWLFINGEALTFSGLSSKHTAENAAILRTTLSNLTDPVIQLTGELRGGQN